MEYVHATNCEVSSRSVSQHWVTRFGSVVKKENWCRHRLVGRETVVRRHLTAGGHSRVPRHVLVLSRTTATESTSITVRDLREKLASNRLIHSMTRNLWQDGKRFWNGETPRGCYVVIFLIIYFTTFYIKCINTTALCKQWADRLQWELQEMGKTGSRVRVVSLLLVLARSWFHHPNPLITVSVALSAHAYTGPMTLFYVPFSFNPFRFNCKLGGLNKKSICHTNQLVPTCNVMFYEWKSRDTEMIL
jgi:hypothetical protein